MTHNFTVIRNDSVPSSQVSIREGHNERRSESPLNADIVPERKELNVHLHQNFTTDGTPETYHQTIDRLLEERKIVKHNFKPKSAIVDEFILDVNSEYFEENGGYEFAKKFYEEAYRYAIKEAGSEDFIVSAILHADERHKELSERYGHDVYHYHLHVIYVPVVQKEVKWTKRAAPELVGKVKEVIPQINHTEKWPRRKYKGKFINEYSKLQDRYFEHMTSAGFPDLQRGERGSASEHLTVEEYKYQQEKKRVEEAAAMADAKEKEAAVLEEQARKTKARVDNLNEQITVKEKAKATIAEVEAIGRPQTIGNGFIVTADELKKLKSLSKKGVGIDKRADEYKKKIETLEGNIHSLKSQITSLEHDVRSIATDRDTWSQRWDKDEGGFKTMELCKSFVQEFGDYAIQSRPDETEFLKWAGKLTGRRNREGILRDAMSIAPVSIANFDRDVMLLNCQNGTLNLNNFALQQHNPADMITKLAPVKYNPKARCPRWDRFIDEVMCGDAALSAYLQKALGYALTGLTEYEIFFILYGEKTRNGKTTLIETIANLLGDYTRNAQAQSLAKRGIDGAAATPDMARLKGARLVTVPEPEKGLELNIALIKQLTGGDTYTARFLNANPFEFKPEFKLFINTNHLPRTADDTVFTSGRVKIIPFDRHFSEQEQDTGLKKIFPKKPKQISYPQLSCGGVAVNP